MKPEIIGLQEWLASPPGQLLQRTEAALFDAALADVFGYHALQLGLPEWPVLQNNRMPHRLVCTDGPAAASALQAAPSALPFPEASLDLVAMPHTLELCNEPHDALREAERVLVPEGRVVISGFNPTSLWGLAQRRSRLWSGMGWGDLYLPESGEFIAYSRLRDWLRFLSFEVESARFALYRPAVKSEAWLERFEWLEAPAARLAPRLGSVYFVVAVKRVRGARMMSAKFKRPAMVGSPVAVASPSTASSTSSSNSTHRSSAPP